MPEARVKEGLLDRVLESVAEEKLSPRDAWDFFSKMDLERKEVLAILASLYARKITASEAKEEITFLATHHKGQHRPA